MKKRIFTLFFVIVTTGWVIRAEIPGIVLSSDDEFEQLMQKIRQSFVYNPAQEVIEKALKNYNEADGSFKDVDYGSIERTNWPPLVHIDRLYDFAFAYTHPQSAYYEDCQLFEKIVKGLVYWHERNPWCHNWWYNQIAEPQKLGVLLIQLRIGKRKLPAKLEIKLLERIKTDGGHPAKWTGANRTDIALHWIYRACLLHDETDLEIALENVYNPIVYTTKEGFQYDNSYFQHGRQLYIGGYGDEILKGVTQVAMYTKGTRYAIPEDKLSLLSKFMRETYYATIRGQHMLFDVLGRGVSRPHIINKSHTSLFAKRMAELDNSNAAEFDSIVARLEGKQPATYAIKPQHTHYYRGDYTLHVRPDYTFDVRMVSNRTIRCEYGNGENLKTYFMSDGCTNIVTTGDEYVDIFPVWNWTCIPGITAPQLNEIPLAVSDWQTPGTSVFAGGVSDGLYGVSAYSYMDTYAGIHTGARKAWFFFDEEVVCLGAGIHSASEFPLYTTVNQCLSSSQKTIWACADGKQPAVMTANECRHHSPEWIIHDGISYLFPVGGKLVVSRKVQSGTWYDINHTAGAKMQQKSVFTLTLDHGSQPMNATYAYIVAPGKDTVDKVEKYKREGGIEIVENTTNKQVVRNKKLGIWEMVFYTPGTFTHPDIHVTVDKACTLMVKDYGKDKADLYIADPAQTESEIEVKIILPARSETLKIVHCSLEKGVFAGSTKTYQLTF